MPKAKARIRKTAAILRRVGWAVDPRLKSLGFRGLGFRGLGV